MPTDMAVVPLRENNSYMSLIGSVETAEPVAYESLYQDSCARLTQQAFLLTGDRCRAEQSVRRAFQLAWNGWDEVAADASPEGWVRAVAFTLALSPWRRARPRRTRHDDGGLGEQDRQLLAALLRLPPAQRRAVVLHDALGLSWEQTALEVESSTPAAYGRVVRGRLALARQVPEVTGADAREPGFGHRLGPLLRGLAVRGCPEQEDVPPPARVRHLARLHEQGINVAAGLATVGVAGGLVAALVVGTPWHPPTPAFVTYGHGTPAAGPAPLPVLPAPLPTPATTLPPGGTTGVAAAGAAPVKVAPAAQPPRSTDADAAAAAVAAAALAHLPAAFHAPAGPPASGGHASAAPAFPSLPTAPVRTGPEQQPGHAVPAGFCELLRLLCSSR